MVQYYLLSINLDKTHYMQFVAKRRSLIDINIMHGNKKIANSCNTTFLRLILDNTLYLKTHINTIIPRLSSASFVIRTVKPFLSQDSLRMVYYSYFHSIMTHGIIFWGNTIAIPFLDYKRELFESSWGKKQRFTYETL